MITAVFPYSSIEIYNVNIQYIFTIKANNHNRHVYKQHHFQSKNQSGPEFQMVNMYQSLAFLVIALVVSSGTNNDICYF